MARARPAERSSSVGPARAAALVLLVVALVGSLAGCGGSSHKQTHSTSTASTSATTKPPAPVIKPIAAGEDVTEPGGDHVRVTIYDLRRSGAFVTLDFGITCENPTAGCTTVNEFASSSYEDYTAGGISLVDPLGNKQYWPVLDAQHHPDSARLPLGISDSQVHLAWVTFAAPPASVATMDVLLPQGGPAILRVPISTGPPPSATKVGAGVVAAIPAQFSQPPGSSSTAGLTLPVTNLVLTVGNPTGSDTVSPGKETVTLHTDVLFAFGKSNLTPRAHQVLAAVASQIKSQAVGPIQVTGYTDSIGTDAVNIPLSEARAQSVAGALRPMTPGVTYQAAGLGAAHPVAPNTKPDGSDNPAGRALNRRVTISFAVKAPAKPKPPPPVTPAAPSTSAAGSLPRTVTYQTSVPGSGVDAYQVTIQQLVRTGDLVVLELSITCQSSGEGQCDANDWSGTSTVPPIPTNQANADQTFETKLNTLTGVYLDDPATGSEYIPVADTSDNPLTTALNPQIQPGQSYTAWAYFPAPPTTSSAVTVALPGGSPRVQDVPIAP